MAKKIKVPMPLISTQTLGSKPIRIGASTVEPNMATTCCRPSAVVCGHGRRSSGATTVPSAAGFSFHSMAERLPRFRGAIVQSSGVERKPCRLCKRKGRRTCDAHRLIVPLADLVEELQVLAHE